MSISTAPGLPSVPAAAESLAAAEGATPYLTGVLHLTRTIFPDAHLKVRAEDDPDIASDRHIVLAVDVPGWTVEQMTAARRRWTSELFERCPAQYVCVFRLLLSRM